jgi:hypothetical protein
MRVEPVHQGRQRDAQAFLLHPLNCRRCKSPRDLGHLPCLGHVQQIAVDGYWSAWPRLVSSLLGV